MRREDVPVDEPCGASWEAMDGEGVRRRCGHCERDVVNLSQMTEREAREFVEEHEAPCVRYHLTRDGELVFRHPQVERQQRGVRHLLGAAALVAPLLLAGAGCDVGGDRGDREASADEPSAPSVAAQVDEVSPVEALETSGEYLAEAARKTRQQLRQTNEAFGEELEERAPGAAASRTDRATAEESSSSSDPESTEPESEPTPPDPVPQPTDESDSPPSSDEPIIMGMMMPGE
jgi:hypothetical protein